MNKLTIAARVSAGLWLLACAGALLLVCTVALPAALLLVYAASLAPKE